MKNNFIDYEDLLKICKDIDLSDKEELHQTSRKFPYPATSISFSTEDGSDDCILGQYVFSQGYAWYTHLGGIYGEDPANLTTLIMMEETKSHVSLVNAMPERYLLMEYYLRGQKEMANDLMQYEAFVEGAAIAEQYILATTYADKSFLDTFLKYVKKRKGTHLLVALKFLELLNLFIALYNRKEEVLSKIKNEYKHTIDEDIDFIKMRLKPPEIFFFVRFIRAYMQAEYFERKHCYSYIDGLLMLIDKLNEIVKAEELKINDVLEFIAFSITHSSFWQAISRMDTLSTLDLLTYCIYDDVKGVESMRMLLTKFNAPTVLSIDRTGEATLIDPFTWWITSTEVSNTPLVGYVLTCLHSKDLVPPVKIDEGQLARILNKMERYGKMLKDAGNLNGWLYNDLMKIRIKYVNEYITKLMDVGCKLSGWSIPIIKAGLDSINVLIEFVKHISSMYKSKYIKDGPEAVLIRAIKESSPSHFQDKWLYYDVCKNVAQLLEGFDQKEARIKLIDLLSYVLTDYDSAELLLHEQIEPLLKNTLNVSRIDLTPYFLL